LPPWSGDDDIEAHTGEICVRGPQVMTGYWGNPEETAAVMEDGWLKTGDIGHMNERGLRHHHRSQEGHDPGVGFQRLSERNRERRGLASGRPRMRRVGVPDERTGEAVKVVIVRKDRSSPAKRWWSTAKAQLTGYKLPRQVEFREALPKSPIGKILRRELRTPPQSGQTLADRHPTRTPPTRGVPPAARLQLRRPRHE
jgi:long-chain acyl-CoA synthetase